MNFCINVFSYCINVCHQLFDIIELILALVNYIFIKSCFSLYFKLFTIKLQFLLLKQTVRLLIIARSALIAINIVSIYQVHVLLHFQMHLLLHISKLPLNINKPFPISLLFLLLLFLTAIGDTNIAIIFFNQRPQLIFHTLHFPQALLNLRS